MSKVIDFQQVLKNTIEHDSQARLSSEFYTLTAVSKSYQVLDLNIEI